MVGDQQPIPTLMKLYYKPGACSQATHITLQELGLNYDLDQVLPETGQTSAGQDYTSINPNGYVPALEIDGGQVLTEGPSILQYLADQNPASDLAPAPGTMERARMQSALTFISSELHTGFRPFFRNPDLAGEARQQAEAGLAKHFDYLEALLSEGQNYLTSKTFTIADAYGFVVSSWAPIVGFDLKPWPKVEAFVERVRARPSVQAALAAEGLLQ
jgi:glutathione S-transferase